MSRKALVLSAVAAFLVVFEGAGSAAGAERWRRPVAGGVVVGAFSYERSAPYERGRRRGVDLRAAPGVAVLAACTGTIAYAGRLPGRRDRGVTIRCGRLVATELGLATVAVRRGAGILEGARIGALGAHGLLRLGARLAGDRRAYLDPLDLLDDPAAPPVAPPPTPLRRPRPHRPTPAPPPPRVAAPARAPRDALPWPALAGLAVLTSSTAGGATLRLRRRARRRARVRSVHAA